jgi:hypothetical protein
MRQLAAALCLILFSVQGANAGWLASAGAEHEAIVRIDWQYPRQLPPRFRNHCTYEYFTARPFCSDHCGSNYQFYYCSEASFGCCHTGRGYCDWNDLLRCHP